MSVYSDPAWAPKYSAVPFAPRGASFEGAHCWGLVHLVFATELGIETPTYAAVSARDVLAAAELFDAQSALPPWRRLRTQGDEDSQGFVAAAVADDILRAFDVVVMVRSAPVRGRYVKGHCGLMLNHRRMIHIERHAGVTKTEITAPAVSWRITGFYRHEALS